MASYNKNDKDSSLPGATSSSPATDQLASKVGETRGAISSDIRELGDKLGSNQLKEGAKNAGKEFAAGAQEAVVDKAIEAKDVVVEKVAEVKEVVIDKAIEVKDAIVDNSIAVADAAAEKLDEVKQSVANTLEDAGELATRWSGKTLKFAKSNAVPLSLVGLGIAWMIGSNARKPAPRDYQKEATRSPKRRMAAEPGTWDLDEDTPLASEYNMAPREKRTTALRANLPDGPASARHKTAEALDQGKAMVRRETSAVRDRIVRAKDASFDFANSNPLAVAMAAFTVGMGVGSLLPTTKTEEKLLLPTRQKFERLVGDVREIASDVVDTAKATANEAARA